MNVYIENILERANPLTVTNMVGGFVMQALHDDALSNNITFAGTSTTINAEWGLNHFADSIAILGSNWTTGILTIWSQGAIVFDRRITSKGKNTIIKLSDTFMISRIALNLSSIDPLEIGILFVGRRVALPLFNVGMRYRLNITSRAERTRYGKVYGIMRPPLRSFEVTFSDIDNSRRLAMEEYIESVQFVKPHIVEPYEADEFLPLYATLTDAGEFDKQKEGGFIWNTALSYMEAK